MKMTHFSVHSCCCCRKDFFRQYPSNCKCSLFLHKNLNEFNFHSTNDYPLALRPSTKSSSLNVNRSTGLFLWDTPCVIQSLDLFRFLLQPSMNYLLQCELNFEANHPRKAFLYAIDFLVMTNI